MIIEKPDIISVEDDEMFSVKKGLTWDYQV